MRTFQPTCLALFVMLAAAPAAAEACSVVSTHRPSAAERMGEARRAVGQATAILDGEVIRALADGQPALVRATNVLKGPAQDLYAIGERDSCDVALTQVGQRLRLILVGGPDLYYLPADSSNARFEDRLLGSDRRRASPRSR